MRTPRTAAVLTAAVLAVTMLGACGGDVDSRAEARKTAAQDNAIEFRGEKLAAQDRNVVNAERRRAANRARLRAAIRARWESRGAIIREVQRQQPQQRRTLRVVRPRPVTEVVYSSIDVCGSKNSRARKQALYYLNLSCPSR